MFELRAFNEQDTDRINSLYTANDMGLPPTYNGITVAVDTEANDDIAGFVRVELWNGIAHVSPIIVDAAYQRRGIGKLLMDSVRKAYDDVRLVARGGAIAFYEALDFDPTDWDLIDPRYSEDCRNCPVRDTCKPVPMRWTAS